MPPKTAPIAARKAAAAARNGNRNGHPSNGNIVASKIEKYLDQHLPAPDPVLKKMETEAHERDIPIVGPSVGRILFQYARALGARQIFEMGSAIGYSTLWLARAVPEGGVVYYTDRSADLAREADRYFQEANVRDRLRVQVGDAIELLKENKGPFDMIFADVDKVDYPRVFALALPRLRRGGLLIADNTLWKGKVAENGGDEVVKAIREYNRLIFNTPGIFSTILPVRDGVGVSLKL